MRKVNTCHCDVMKPNADTNEVVRAASIHSTTSSQTSAACRVLQTTESEVRSEMLVSRTNPRETV